jgi:1,4-dihydroxy-2-naphthoyl-CoA hydrolase
MSMSSPSLLEQLNASSTNTLSAQLGIRFTRVEPGLVEATMPVDHRTHQPFGMLHGGASVALAETVGSVGSNMLAGEGRAAVGLEINANHVKSIRTGEVLCTARIVHQGKQTHIWDIRITGPEGQLICISRFTAAIIDLPKP